MKSLILALLLPASVNAAYILNPYTNQKDYYQTAVEQNYAAVSATVTLQGNTFNGANQLVKTGTTGKFPASVLPTDGYSSTYVNVGEAIPGSVVDLSTVTAYANTKVSKSGDTMMGNLLVGASVQANIFQGDGSRLSGVITSTGAIVSRLQNQEQYALSTGTAFGGDVSGSYNAIAVANDSHAHSGTTVDFSTVTAFAIAQRDNLGNHTATQTLNLDYNNISNVDKMAVGNVVVDYSGTVLRYPRTPTFKMDVLGDSAIQNGSQIFSKDIVLLSSSSTLSPFIIETSVDCSGTGVCGISNPSGIASENGSYWGFYGGAGDSVILSIRYIGFAIPDGYSIIGAEGYIKKYATDQSKISSTRCKMFYPIASQEIGINQCESNDWSNTVSTAVYGNSSYSWGVDISTTMANSDDFGWGMALTLTGAATAYVDVMKMRLFYVDDKVFKAGFNQQSFTLDYNGSSTLYVSTYSSVGIMKQPTPPYELDVEGDINFSGSLYQNGVEFVGGSGGGDNLGSHIATMTVQAPYGIYASTISLTNTGNSITSLGGISVGANTSGLNNLGVFNFSQASNPYRLYLYDPTKTLSLVAGDGGKMSVISTSGTELLGVKNNGSELAMVGISSTTPTHTLSVQGDINYSGAIYKNGISWPSGYDFIPSTATGYYGIYVASAGYAANGGGGGAANTWVEQNFYSQTNGTQTQFTLPSVPLTNSLRLTKNGVVMVAPSDYSLSNAIITMVTAPVSSTTLIANYAIADSSVGITTSSPTWTGSTTFTGAVSVSSFTALDMETRLPKFRAVASAEVVHPTINTPTKVLFNTKSYEVGAGYDTTNSWYIVPSSGIYHVSADCYFYDTIVIGSRLQTMIYLNGAVILQHIVYASATNVGHSVLVASDYYLPKDSKVEVYIQVGNSNAHIYNSADSTFWSIHRIP